ncbi:MAG: ABC transporter substrate-binding protein [Clostridia bacterium]|nr:ABC transporter substrate-binding protein [Clostridia bacterium]
MKKFLLPFLLLAILITTACHGGANDNESIYSFTDSLNREVQLYTYEKTAVISGSLAEIWQSAGGKLYGITNDAYSGHTLDIPENVKNYGDVKNPSVESMISDGVDFVILSASIANHLKLENVLESAGITVAYFDVEDFEDYLSMLKICTDITGRGDLYTAKGEHIRERVEASIARSQGKEQPSVLLLRAFSTGIKAKAEDNMTGKMLADLGCINIAESQSSLLEELSLESIILADPDFIFITTMGDYDAAVAYYETELATNPAWQELSAVKSGNVYVLPKDMFHYKPNARWGEAYEYLEDILYDQE